MTSDFKAVSILVGLLYWNYFMTVVTDPGSVPKLWVRACPVEWVISVLKVQLSLSRNQREMIMK